MVTLQELECLHMSGIGLDVPTRRMYMLQQSGQDDAITTAVTNPNTPIINNIPNIYSFLAEGK